jgi:hypothetical protein
MARRATAIGVVRVLRGSVPVRRQITAGTWPLETSIAAAARRSDYGTEPAYLPVDSLGEAGNIDRRLVMVNPFDEFLRQGRPRHDKEHSVPLPSLLETLGIDGVKPEIISTLPVEGCSPPRSSPAGRRVVTGELLRASERRRRQHRRCDIRRHGA